MDEKTVTESYIARAVRSNRTCETMKMHKCSCGEIDPSKLYGNKKHVCASCHNEYTKRKGKETRK